MIRLKPARHRPPRPGASPRARLIQLGLGTYIALAVVLGLLAVKPQVQAQLGSGTTITAEFADSYKLRKYDSSIKLAGLIVGSVVDIDETDRGTSLVTMKIDDETLDKMGSTPTAEIEPRTLLGGRYAIEVHPGGTKGPFEGDSIPLERTTKPVELDSILEALPATALEGVQGTVGKAGRTLAAGKGDLKHLLRDAPDVLDPAYDVVDAARGTRPNRDLAELVTGLQAVSDALTRRDGRLDRIAHALNETSQVLAARRAPLAETLRNLPATVHSARVGMVGLHASIDELDSTARKLRPTAPEVADLIAALDPMLKQARPLLRDLKPLLRDARPAVQQLVPTARSANAVLGDLKGPVLERVNGPVMSFLLNRWSPSADGPYKDSAQGYQADHRFYEELAYMASNIDAASMLQDQRGSTLAFQAGVGTGSVSGLPLSIENIVKLALQYAGGTP